MSVCRPFCLCLAAALALAPWLHAAEPAYQNDFQKAEVGKLPDNFLVMAGAFAVQQEGDQRYIELPGAPLDTFGLLFGPSQPAGGNVTARFFGTKQGRKFPAFGVSLGGVGGYRLRMSGAKKALEIVKGDETLASTPFAWNSGAWLHLRLQIVKSGSGWAAQGRAWPDGSPEPAEWGIHFDLPQPPPAGRPAVWGEPYSGTPIRFDDFVLDAAP